MPQPAAVPNEVVQHAQNAAEMQVKMSLEEPAAPYESQQASLLNKTQATASQTSVSQAVNTDPMTPEEMKAIIAQAKAGQADDDCLMCGS